MRQVTGLNPAFAEILRKDRKLSEASHTSDVVSLKKMAKAFLDYCIRHSAQITDTAERSWLGDRIDCWTPVAYLRESFPVFELKKHPIGYTFRTESQRGHPWHVDVEGLYRGMVV